MPHLKAPGPTRRPTLGPLFTDSDNGRRVPILPARIFVTGLWEVVVHHLASYAVSLQLEGTKVHSSVSVVTDMELIERRFDRSAERAPFSQEMIRTGFLILRLGFQATKNIELPNVVYEALRVREPSDLPVFIVCEPFRPWSKSHVAWSEDLDRLLEARFLRVTIKP